MKKKIALISFLVFIAIILVSIAGFLNWHNNLEPLDVSIEVNGEQVEYELGDYCWGVEKLIEIGIDRHCTYKEDPTEIAKNVEPIVVEPSSTLEVYFERQPKVAGVLDYNNNFLGSPIDILDGEIPLPSNPGVYTYVLNVAWAEGNANYIFNIQVEGDTPSDITQEETQNNE